MDLVFSHLICLHSFTEIIPSASTFIEEDYVEIICESQTVIEKAEKLVPVMNVVGTASPPTPSSSDKGFFYYYGAPVLILLIAMALGPHSLDYVVFFLGHNSKFWRAAFIDCYVNFLCWSCTYLFVRRLLNPETSKVVFEKYSADAFYGGLAAASTAFMKPILLAALQT